MASFPLKVDEGSPFPIENIPFGIFSTQDGRKRAGTVIGDHVVDLAELESAGVFTSVSDDFGTIFAQV